MTEAELMPVHERINLPGAPDAADNIIPSFPSVGIPGIVPQISLSGRVDVQGTFTVAVSIDYITDVDFSIIFIHDSTLF
jgi:hypothetical protein